MAITDETMLILVDSVNNNNKFYHVTLDDADVVTKRWGRVGTKGTVSRENTGITGYWRAIDSKKKKGYRVTDVNATHVSTSGATNSVNLEQIAQKHLTTDPTNLLVSQLISRIVSANKHQIMEQSGGQITVSDDGLVRTALGIVNQRTINEARSVLHRLILPVGSSTKHDLEEYLTLIPQDVGRRRGWDAEFLTNESLRHQQDFLTQLESSVQWYDKTLAAAKMDADKDIVEQDHSGLFRMKLGYLDKTDPLYRKIERTYMDSRNRHHSSRTFKLVNVYTVTDDAHAEVFNATAQKLGNVKQLWHGTSVSNVLSILTKGLFIPKSSGGDGIKIAGRMFGDALYFSSQSSKSLNYSTNFWHGGPRRSNNCFMFFNDIVMGNEFRPTHWDYRQKDKAYNGTDSKGRRFNSIYVKGGTCGVLNDEMMVWNTDQIKLNYLCEFEQ